MALQKQVISYPLVNGIDTKDAPTLTPDAYALMVDNMKFTKGPTGSLTKRDGFAPLTTNIIGGGSLQNGTAVFQRSQELCVIADGGLSKALYSYADAAGAWLNKGNLPARLRPFERPVANTSYSVLNGDGAVVNNTGGDPVGFYAWSQSDGVWLSVVDETSGMVYQTVRVATDGVRPQVYVFNGRFLLLYMASTGQVWRVVVDPNAPAASPAAVPLFAVIGDGGSSYAAAVFGTSLCVATILSSSLRLDTFNASFTPTATAAPGFSGLRSVFAANVNSFLVVTWRDGTSNVNAASFTPSTLAGLGSSTMALEGPPVLQDTIYSGSGNLGRLMVTTQIGGDANTTAIFVLLVDGSNGALGAPVLSVRSLGQASKQFFLGGFVYTYAILPSVDQATIFLLDQFGVAEGKFFNSGLAGSLAGSSAGGRQLPSVSTIGSTYYAPLSTSTVVDRTVSPVGVQQPGASTTQFTNIFGLTLLRITSSETVVAAQLGLDQHFATGSYLYQYDGTSVTEQGFNYFPPTPTGTNLGPDVQWVQTQAALGDGTTPQTAVLVFPANVNDNLAADASIQRLGVTAGDYFTFGGVLGDNVTTPPFAGYCYYVVDGVGTDPALGGVFSGHGFAIPVSSGDTGAALAYKTGVYMEASPAFFGGGALYDIAFAPTNSPSDSMAYRVGIKQRNNLTKIPSIPAMNRQFVVNDTAFGAPSPHNQVNVVECCEGNLISAGQYCVLNSGISNVKSVVPWFKVDGVGTQPSANTPYDPVYIEVDVLSNYSAVAVAGALYTALSSAGVPVLGDRTFTVSGSQVTVFEGSSAIHQVLSYNPIIGGVGQNYLGAANGFITPPSTDLPYGAVAIGYDSYLYETVFESVDAQGQLSQSAPSDPLTITIPNMQQGVGNGVVALELPTYRVTRRPSVDIAVYRTQADGVVFQRASSPTDLIFSSTTVDTVPFADTVPDATLAGLGLLYTTGGVRPYDSPPAAGYVAAVADRLWLASLEDPTLFWYSNEFAGGLGVSWSADNTIRLDPAYGDTVGVAPMDSNTALLGTEQIGLMSGDGPDLLGQGGFSSVSLISSVGARDPLSIVSLGQTGIIYKGRLGFWMVDRKAQENYIGLGVEAFNADVVNQAVIKATTQEIYFLSESGQTLRYDYLYQQWGTMDPQGVGAVLRDGVYTFLQADGTVLYETPGAYLDNGVGYGWTFQGPWWKVGADVQGFKRVWEFLVKGSFTGQNPIQVAIDVDYRDDLTYTVIYQATAGVGGTWGSDPLWGESTPWGAGGSSTFPPSLQFRVKNKVQKAESYRITISELAPFPGNVAASLDAVDLECGVKVGGFKRLGAGQTIG